MIEPQANPRLRVALLSPCYWPEVLRGTERITRELADGLLSRGHAPYLITSHPGLPRRAQEGGLPVLRLPRPPQGFLVRKNFEEYMTHVPFSYFALRSHDCDIAHAMYPTDALAAARWRRKTKRPALLSYMGIPEPRWLHAQRWRMEILSRAVAGTDAVVVLSKHAASALRVSLGHEAVVIHPGVDLTVFQAAQARSERPTIICTAAVEVGRKNVGLLIEAFALVRERYADARLVLVRPQDAAAAEREGVKLDSAGLEWIDHDQRAGTLARAYAEAWVAVLPAVGEAFGKVLIEALACGTPIVGYADAGIPEIIDRPEIGMLFDRLDPVTLAGALIKTLELSTDPGTSAQCRKRAADFSTERCTEQYLALYRKLIDGATGAPLRHQLARAPDAAPVEHQPYGHP